MKRIVIVGGGCAGIMAANRMRGKLDRDEAEITLIEKSEKHVYQPGFLTLLFDLDKPESLIRNTGDLLLKGVDLIIDKAVSIDPEGKVTSAKHGDIIYDYLVIATGAKLYLDEPEGMKEGLEQGKNVFTFYNMEGATKLREALKGFKGGTIVSSIAEMPIKCLGAPVEFIMMAESEMRRRGIRDKCEFLLTTPSLSIPPNIEPYAGALEKILKARGIKVMTEFTPATIDAEGKILKDFLGNQVNFDLLCIIPPHMGEEIIQNSIGDELGWITCDRRSLRHKNFDNIYVIGDAANIPSGKTSSAARKQAIVLAQRMKSHIRGKEPEEVYDGYVACPILTGYRRAMFAEFNYAKSISPPTESYAKWLLHIYLLRWLYWNFILKGRLFF